MLSRSDDHVQKMIHDGSVFLLSLTHSLTHSHTSISLSLFVLTAQMFEMMKAWDKRNYLITASTPGTDEFSAKGLVLLFSAASFPVSLLHAATYHWIVSCL